MRLLLLAALVAGCATAPRPPHDQIAARFRHRIDFERGKREATAVDSIDVIEMWGTRPEIEIGGVYLVRGRYTLGSEEQGTVFFFMTADNWDNSGPVIDLQRADARRGTGTFVLQHEMTGPGWFHVYLHGGNRDLADLYFGKGDTLLAAGDGGGRGGQRTVAGAR